MVKPCRTALALALALALASLGARASAAGADEGGMPPFPAATDEGSSMIWLRDHTSLGVGRFVAFAPDNVTVVLTDEVATRAPTVHRITFRQEATRVDFVSRTGGRSLRGSGEVDCATGSFRADKVELFSGTDLHGDRVASEGPDTVGRVPRAGSGPAQAVAQVCGGQSALAPLVSTARRSGPIAPSTAVTTADAAPARPAPPPPPPPPPREEASPLSSFAPRSEPTPLPPPPRRGPAPQATPLPDLPPRPAEAEPSAPPPSPPAPAAAVGEPVAQIGAFTTREAAERAWTRISELFPDLMAGKVMRVDTVMVNGMPMYRSAIGGFASSADALALCSRLMASSEACFVRKGP